MLIRSSQWLFLSCFGLLMIFGSPSQGAPNKGSLWRAAEGRSVFYQPLTRTTAEDTGKPTLVFLPGVNRALPADYPALQALAQKGYPGLITATSSHWQSLQETSGQTYFEKHPELRVQDFTAETEGLISNLKISNPVLISLSYSSAIAAFSKYRKIYVAPLVKASDSDPQAAQAAAAWEAGLSLNIFMGPLWIRQFRDTNYWNYWSSVVSQTLAANPQAYGSADSRLVTEGYASISRAVEDFDFTQVAFKGQPNPFDFVLGENEAQVRLRGQIETVQNAATAGATRVIFIRHAEHNVPESQPQAYAAAIDALLTSPSAVSLQVGVIDPQQSLQIRWLSSSEIKTLFAFIGNFPDTTDAADLSSVLSP